MQIFWYFILNFYFLATSLEKKSTFLSIEWGCSLIIFINLNNNRLLVNGLRCLFIFLFFISSFRLLSFSYLVIPSFLFYFLLFYSWTHSSFYCLICSFFSSFVSSFAHFALCFLPQHLADPYIFFFILPSSIFSFLASYPLLLLL